MRATSTASHDCRMACTRAARCGGDARGAPRAQTRYHAHAQAQHHPCQGQQQLQHAQQPTFPAPQKAMQALHGTSTAAPSITLVRATLSIRIKPPCQFSQHIDDAFMYTITNIMLHNAISHMFFAGNAQPGGDDRHARRSHERAQLPSGLEPDAPLRPRDPRSRIADPLVLLSLLLRTVTYNDRPQGPPRCARALSGRKVQHGLGEARTAALHVLGRTERCRTRFEQKQPRAIGRKVTTAERSNTVCAKQG